MVLLGHIMQKNKDKIMIKYIDSEKLIDKIESRMELRNDVRNADEGYYPESKFMICDDEDDEIYAMTKMMKSSLSLTLYSRSSLILTWINSLTR